MAAMQASKPLSSTESGRPDRLTACASSFTVSTPLPIGVDSSTASSLGAGAVPDGSLRKLRSDPAPRKLGDGDSAASSLGDRAASDGSLRKLRSLRHFLLVEVGELMAHPVPLGAKVAQVLRVG